MKAEASTYCGALKQFIQPRLKDAYRLEIQLGPNGEVMETIPARVKYLLENGRFMHGEDGQTDEHVSLHINFRPN